MPMSRTETMIDKMPAGKALSQRLRDRYVTCATAADAARVYDAMAAAVLSGGQYEQGERIGSVVRR